LVRQGVGVQVIGMSIMELAQTAVIVPATHWHLQAASERDTNAGKSRIARIASLNFIASSPVSNISV
jgi:hypothetical protein